MMALVLGLIAASILAGQMHLVLGQQSTKTAVAPAIQIASPLKSATTTELGSFPAGYGDPAASKNVPSPFPSNTVTLFEVELAITKSTGATVTRSEERRVGKECRSR